MRKIIIYKSLSILFIVVSVFLISERNFGRLNVSPDKLKQYAVGKQLSLGNGFTFPEYNEGEIIYKPVTSWPPGLSLISGLLFFFFNDFYVINLILLLSNYLILIILICNILQILLKRKLSLFEFSLVLLIFTLNGLTTTPSITDLICLNLFLFSFITLHKFNKTRKNKYLLIANLAVVSTFYFRYAYLPAIVVIPLYFIIIMIKKKSNNFKPLILSIVFIMVFAIPLWGHVILLNKQYILTKIPENTVNKLYWENLLHADPFPLNAFFSRIYILKTLGYNSQFGFDRGYIYPRLIQYGFYFISFLILLPIFLLIFYRNKILKINDNINTTNINSFFLYSGLFALVLITFIYLLSILTPSLVSQYNWSFAKVPRYYYTPITIIIISYLFMFFLEKKVNNNILRWFVSLTLISSILFHSIFIMYGYIENYNPYHFKHNTSILRENNGLLNSYNVYEEFNKNNQLSLIIIDKDIENKFFKLSCFMAMANMVVISENVYELKNKSEYPLYIITKSSGNKDKKSIDKIIEKTNANKIKTLENDILIYSSTLK